MKLLSSVIAAGCVLAAATTASAIVTVDYSWEDGGTVLGSFGNVTNPLNVASGTDPYSSVGTVAPRSGSAMLQVTEAPHGGTPQAFLAVVSGVSSGAQVSASFYGWDSTGGASPSMRIWGAWISDPNDVGSYVGSAGGNDTYTADSTGGVGEWSQVDHTWTFNDATQGLLIHARLYSTPSSGDYSTDFWVDDLRVEAPDGATITVPIPEPSTLALIGLGALAMAFRRRK